MASGERSHTGCLLLFLAAVVLATLAIILFKHYSVPHTPCVNTALDRGGNGRVDAC